MTRIFVAGSIGLLLAAPIHAAPEVCAASTLEAPEPWVVPSAPPVESLAPFSVQVVVLTEHADAPTADSMHTDPEDAAVSWTGREVLEREVEAHLEQYFVNASGDAVCGEAGCIEFALLDTVFRDDIVDTECGLLLDLADSGSSGAFDFDGEDSLGDALINAAAQCDDERVRAQGAINLYVYDYCSGTGESDCSATTSFGGELLKGGCYTPAVFLDIARLQHRGQAPEEHEMGHALGLQHNCDPGITDPTLSSNIMQSTCGSDAWSGGLRDLGFGEIFDEQDHPGEAYDQQAVLLSTAALIQGNWCGDWADGAGDEDDGIDEYGVDVPSKEGCAVVRQRHSTLWTLLFVVCSLVWRGRRKS